MLYILDSVFQKADSDLDYIQYRLEYEIKTNYPDSAGKLSKKPSRKKGVEGRELSLCL